MILKSQLKVITYLSIFYLLALLFLACPGLATTSENDTKKILSEIQRLKEKLKQFEDIKRQLHQLEQKLQQVQKQQKEQKVKTKAVKEALAIGKGKKQLKLGGALRFNYFYKDFEEKNESKGGDMDFDIFRLDVDGKFNNFLMSAQYRWYSYMDVIHHGWIGYKFNDVWQGRVGITQVPFGILPYASHNWWFGVPYYIGLEDDYDMGIKVLADKDPWDLQLAFFKNAEWGDPSNKDRYSFDIIKDSQKNEETNQFNARLSYTLDHQLGQTEFGISGQVGQLYNSLTDDLGNHWATAVHLDSRYGPWNLQLQAGLYQYNPDNPSGVDEETVIMGAFGTSYPVASDGAIYVANLSYELPIDFHGLEKLTFYNDYSLLVKEESGFENSQINTLGCLISASPVFTYVDLIFGKNVPFLGLPSGPQGETIALGKGENHPEWETRFNINFGIYF